MMIEMTLPLMGAGTLEDTWEALDVGNLLDLSEPLTVYMDDYHPANRTCSVRIEGSDRFVAKIQAMGEAGRWDEVAEDMRRAGRKRAALHPRIAENT